MSNDENPKVEAQESIVEYCPFCGVNYSEAGSGNRKITCPVEGGCGQSYYVKKHDKAD